MRVDVADLFPTALGIYKWDHEKHMELKKLTQELIKTRKRMDNPLTEDIGHYYNVSEENLLDEDYPIIKEFSEFLSRSYVDYTQAVYNWDLTREHFISECWVNVTKQGGWQYKHSHANSFVSGTYYLNFPSTATGITFHSSSIEKSDPYLCAMPREQNKYNSESLTMTPKETILFLWPSNLTHDTKKLEADVKRVSISMNFVPSELTTGIYSIKLSK